MKRTGEANKTGGEKNVKRSLNKTTLAFVVLFVLGIIGIIFVILFVNKATSLELKEDTFQYYCTSQIYYEPGSSLTNSEMSTIIVDDTRETSVDNTPLYSKAGNAIYLPESYSYCSVDDNTFWRIPEFMKLTVDSNHLVTCTFNEDYYEIKHGFLFDDGFNYIFLDSGKIYINDVPKYSVSTFSFFSKDFQLYRIYDTGSKEFIQFANETSNVKYVSDGGYSVDLYRGVYTDSKDEEQLLIASPSLLTSIDER